MANAKQLSSGTWRVQVYAGKDASGKRQYKSITADTERKANLAALEWQEHYKAVSTNSINMTVSEAIEAHISSKSNRLSPATIAGYHRIKKNRLAGLIDVKLKKLTQKMIETEFNTECGKYSAKTVYNDFSLLSTVIKKYRPDFKFKVDMPIIYPVIKDIPTDGDLRKIYALAYGTEMELPILLASWLGMRISEIRGLKSHALTGGKVIIREAIVQGDDGAADKGPKSKDSARVLELPKYIQERAATLISDGREYVTALSGQAIYKRFVRLCEKAGVGPYRFHDLRHMNATIMLEENVPDKYIAERGGWGSDIYKKRYEHTTVAKRSSVSEMIDHRFEKIMQHEMQHGE